MNREVVIIDRGGDSVILPPSTKGVTYTVHNESDRTIKVFPSGTEIEVGETFEGGDLDGLVKSMRELIE